jgi:hypothetical protein
MLKPNAAKPKNKIIDLNEAEKDAFADMFFNSDHHKVIAKILAQLTAQYTEAALTVHQDGSDEAKNKLSCAIIEIQGMNKLARDFRALKDKINQS